MNTRRASYCLFIALTLSALVATAQDTAKGTPAPTSTDVSSSQNSLNLPFGTRINVEISKDLDAKRLKRGDSIEARVIEAVKINGNTMVPRNSTVRGHVTEVAARSKKDQNTTLGLAFDDALHAAGVGQRRASAMVVEGQRGPPWLLPDIELLCETHEPHSNICGSLFDPHWRSIRLSRIF